MRRARRTRAILGLLAAMSWLSLVPAMPAGQVAMAASSIIDVSPEHGAAQAGDTVTITVTVHDDDGSLDTGPGSNTHIRFVFMAGSPNDPGGGGHDLDCHTGQTGSCQVSYVAAAAGTDTICAWTTGSSAQCTEAVDAPELNDRVDTIEIVVGGTPAPTPTPTPSPVAEPTATPTPTPAPTATPTPEPTATPAPTATPTPEPTATPTPEPTATPTPEPTATATPAPTATPTPAPTATPAPTPTPTPEPSATATPEPTATPTPEPTAIPAPTATPSPDATATPEPTATPSAIPGAAIIGGGSSTTDPGPSDGRGTDPGTPGGAPVAVPVSPAPAKGLLEAILEPPRAAVAAIVSGVAERVGTALRPDAVEAVATTFTFPLLLMAAVCLFLLVQWRMDDRDPKLRNAPLTAAESTLAFDDEGTV